FDTMILKDFLYYLSTDRTDYIFYILIFVFSKFEIPFELLFLLLTTFTVGIWYFIFLKINRKFGYKRPMFFVFFCLIFVAFSPSGLFSGVRFYLAVSVALLAFANMLLHTRSF